MKFFGTRSVRVLLACAALLAIAGLAHAHQMQVAITTVTFNLRTDSIEVIHRFFTHDTEHAMAQITGRSADIILDEMVQQQFGLYVGRNFKLFDQDSTEIPLALVGVELEGDVIWVYQEAPVPGDLTELAVINSALLDLIPNQVNTVNVECGDDLSTLSFSRGAKPAVADIGFGSCVH